MEKQFDTQQESSLSEDILRALLESEVVLIGGGQAATSLE
jgi:hypothetical protein